MSRHTLTKDFWLPALRAEGDAFREAVSREGILDSRVPSCPEWTVADLVRHVGRACAWMGSHVNRGVVTFPGMPDAFDRPDLHGAEVLAWMTDQYVELLAMFDALDPELPAWNFAPQPKKAVFWVRRMAHETSIHRWDAQMASGLAEPIPSKLAADGVSEVFEAYLPGVLSLRTPQQTTQHSGIAALHASDVDQEWYVRLRGGGIALLDTDTLLDDHDHHERVTATGTASDLVLALWGRVPLDVLRVSGDATLLDALRVG